MTPEKLDTLHAPLLIIARDIVLGKGGFDPDSEEYALIEKVYAHARVFGNAWVYENARVYGNAEVYEDAAI